jgi:hypothetical protein
MVSYPGKPLQPAIGLFWGVLRKRWRNPGSGLQHVGEPALQLPEK